MSYKTHMHGQGESHSGVVLAKRPNAGQGGPKETAEGRPLTKENAEEPNPYWMQGQESGTNGLDRVRQAAQRDKQLRFTALLHHVNIDRLRDSYYDLKRRAAAGVDGVTWQEYGDGLEERLADLHGRIHRGAYRAQPSRRVWIDKADGRKRPLGIAALEDKIAQAAVVEVLNPIWEEDFLGFSYGFRPGRQQHDALDALYVGITGKKVNYVLDLDIRSFFDNIPQDLLMRAVKKHAKEQWMVLYIERWPKAPVQEEDGQLIPREKGTPQGGVISPLLANLFLHYAFDRWMAKQYPQMPFERYADDAIVHCRTEREAQEVRAAIAARLKEWGLELHPEKTKVVYCKDDDRRRTYPNEKFDFLGYTFRAAEIEESVREVLHQFQPGSFRQGGESHPGRDSKLGPAFTQRQAHRGSIPDVQPEDPRLAPILRAVLSLGAVSADAPTGSLAGPLGRAEIQEAARSFAQGRALGGAHFPARPEAVCALADGRAAWLHGGSRMS